MQGGIRTQVLAVEYGENDRGDALYVWDGNDTPRRSIQDWKLLEGASGMVYPSEANCDKRLMPIGPFKGPHVGPEEHLPVLGTALPVIVSGPAGRLQLPEAGQWVKLRNVGIIIVKGQWQVCSSIPYPPFPPPKKKMYL